MGSLSATRHHPAPLAPFKISLPFPRAHLRRSLPCAAGDETPVRIHPISVLRKGAGSGCVKGSRGTGNAAACSFARAPARTRRPPSWILRQLQRQIPTMPRHLAPGRPASSSRRPLLHTLVACGIKDDDALSPAEYSRLTSAERIACWAELFEVELSLLNAGSLPRLLKERQQPARAGSSAPRGPPAA